MSHAHPGPLRRLALRAYRVLPAGPSHVVTRAVLPSWGFGAVALIEYDGRVLALRQTHRIGLSLPGGHIDRGEHPSEAVVREVWEETGLRITPGDAFATVFDPRTRIADVIYRVRCDREPKVRVASEAVGYEWVDPENWPQGEADESTERILRGALRARTTPQPGGLVADD
ncbi:NUDIX domain-containing protein [Allobranchiibius sp. GilTou73]|uniref:NUDIX domain-containing protein n=1 Tax=Allobranchiibius sp. GilTou73 TaxID=2904523 RepID=UPI001F24DBF0|nr:NUDIX domain-containing protein [Allobranchiibius sp. GilTou73]UIJ35772.1 NUDIX domain-containing protein [Allobranchiibius sp. GilTou73]